MNEIGYWGWKKMMLVVELFMTWMILFVYNGYTIICIQSMNWVFNVSWFWNVVFTVAAFN